MTSAEAWVRWEGEEWGRGRAKSRLGGGLYDLTTQSHARNLAVADLSSLIVLVGTYLGIRGK